jgi:hypothetical protein
VPGPAGSRRGRAGPGQPHRPDPAVHSPSLIVCHPPNCNPIRSRRPRQPDVFREGPAACCRCGRVRRSPARYAPKKPIPAKTQRC